MDIYHIWCDLKPEVSDVQFVEAVHRYLGKLVEAEQVGAYRICRRKLGLGPTDLGEFHISIEVRDLAQLDEAFREVSSRSDPVESFHAAVNQSVMNLTFALYRDFPDPHRKRGQEKF
ncbi:MAG: hypothetical protein OXU20_34435 [Myxococcales bacterium]|nr:hypothetical protein [Myxococcales bacterium]MDD9970503.1 hypothetical protein [Myxococcales bacterium]